MEPVGGAIALELLGARSACLRERPHVGLLGGRHLRSTPPDLEPPSERGRGALVGGRKPGRRRAQYTLGTGDYRRLARALGLAQGRIAVTGVVPDHPWLTRSFLRDYVLSKRVDRSVLYSDEAGRALWWGTTSRTGCAGDWFA